MNDQELQAQFDRMPYILSLSRKDARALKVALQGVLSSSPSIAVLPLMAESLRNLLKQLEDL